MTSALAPIVTPAGAVRVEVLADAAPISDELAARLVDAFARGGGAGLLQLGAAEVGVAMPPVFAYWRTFAARYVTDVCALRAPTAPAPAVDELDAIAAAAPPMVGGEYLRGDVLAAAWAELASALAGELATSGETIEAYLHARNAAWHLVGRVHFNLAENRDDDDAPFAFLATYTTKLTAGGKAQHAPLGQALREYAGDANKARMLSLLEPVRRAAASCAWLATLVERGELFHPLRWSVGEARALLDDVPALEAAGVVVRVPGAWHAGRPARPQVTATVGAKPPGGVGAAQLLDFAVDVTLDGETLTRAEIDALLAAGEGLQLVRGRWVEIDRGKLGAMLDRFRAAARAAEDGLGFAQAMRALAGADPAHADALVDPAWTRVTAGPWLERTLAGLRDPARLDALAPGDDLRATLRPYQQVGLRWLHLLSELGLGACLADDMGLGKTVQVIALLVVLRRGAVAGAPRRTSVLVAPASLIGNWTAELARFAPSLRVVVAHPSAMAAGELGDAAAPALGEADLVITSYGTLARTRWLRATAWRLAILDEAQAIKNPGAQQTKAVKQLDAAARLALTGTPVENRLGDLWSLFDFLSPGLLGTTKEFTAFTRALAADTTPTSRGFAPLRTLVAPYILRRLKTDRSVIADLPDKSEVVAYCGLSRAQVALYQRAVDELATKLRTTKSIERRGIVLAALVRMKQICNHPAHWHGAGDDWAEADSGKLVRLRELCEVIAAKQDKLLVFTQFRETCAPIASFLAGVFGRAGLVLHGAVAVAKRSKLVAEFQTDERVPFFVLSLKAGGTGLNLTAASHVIHFDRWWNPAVEDQATDRAYRIGQHRNVLVHKFVCRGTVEDKIDAMITGKRKLARDLLDTAGAGDELKLTELSDRELMDLVTLDLRTAQQER